MRALAAILIGIVLLSCATLDVLPPVSMDLFVPAPEDDPWRHKIQDWQDRHEDDPARKGQFEDVVSDLGKEYEVFKAELRRRMVSETVTWIQERSRKYYRSDVEHDHWATLGEVIKTGGDDCDGLDLLTFQLLRRMGFSSTEIYRSIVVEQDSGQHHMVTLWFDQGQGSDPYLLDPTGVVTESMQRLSEIDGWEPIQLFDERAHYRVESVPANAVAGR